MARYAYLGTNFYLNHPRFVPGQVADVSTLIPGRSGTAVSLSEVLRLATAAPNARVVIIATDGMTTDPVSIDDVGEAVLVHSLDGQPFPAKQGGPYRLFSPPSEAQSGCGNVKSVCRIMVISP